MSVTTKVARAYAEALAGAAAAKNALPEAAAEVLAFTALVNGNAELRGVFASPALAPEMKIKVLDALVERTRPNPLVANFLRVLLRNNRLHDLEVIQRALADEVDKREGVVSAEVTTARSVTDAERATLEAKLVGLTGKRMRLSYSTDPELIGGVVTRIGSVIYDGSIRTKLDTIKRRMAG
jgi:F-type H+-transporting ATPase subunit delta